MKLFFSTLLEGLRIAFRALKANKTRTILTTLGIVIGVVTVTLMLMIIQGLNKSFAQQIAFIGSRTVYIEQFPWIIMDDWWRYRNRPRLTMENFEAVKEQADLAESVAAYSWTVRPIAFRDKTSDGVGIVGCTPEFAITSDFIPETGRFITQTDIRTSRKVCVIGSEIAEQFFEPFDPVGRDIRIGAFNFKVVGVLEEKGTSFGESNDNNILIPLSTMMDNYGFRRGVTICVMGYEGGDVEALKDELTGIMRRSRNLTPSEEDNFAINEQSMLMDFYKRITAGVYGAGVVIGGISLLVGGIGIMNIMLVSVTERTWEIGMRKAVGAKNYHILWQFLVEAMTICASGGVIGILLAAAGGQAMKSSLPTSLPIWLALSAMLFSAVVGLIFGLFPAFRASRMDPITALRQE